MNNLVIHPSHYNQEGRKECWDEMMEKFGKPATAYFDMMNAYKYKYRAGSKNDNPEEQDMAKIENCMQHAHLLILELMEDSATEVTPLIRCYTKVREEIDNG